MKNKLKELVTPSYENIIKVIKFFLKCIGMEVIIECTDTLDDGVSLMYSKEANKWVTTPVNVTANKALITARNQYTDFQKAHGTANYGNHLYIGTRYLNTDSGIPTLVHYPDCTDLSTFQKIEITGLGLNVGAIESLCYSTVTNKVYAPLEGSNKLLIADMTDINTYSINTISLPSSAVFGGSSPIITDDTYLYIANEGALHYIVKILISTLTVVDSLIIPNGSYHAGTINDTKDYGFFMNNTSSIPNVAFFIKLKLDDLTYQEIALNHAGFTDDMVFIPAIFPDPNIVIVGSEVPNEGLQLVAIDVDAMVSYSLNMDATLSIKYDSVTDLILSASFGGGIEVVTRETLVNYMKYNNYVDIAEGSIYDKSFISRYNYFKNNTVLYTIKDENAPLNYFLPNEIFITPNGYYTTIWDATDNLGRLIKFELVRGFNPLQSITKNELVKYDTSLRVKEISDNAVTTSPTGYMISTEDFEFNKLLIFNTNTNINVTIPSTIVSAFSRGSNLRILKEGTGTVTLISIDTLISETGSNIISTNKMYELYKIKNGTWYLRQ